MVEPTEEIVNIVEHLSEHKTLKEDIQVRCLISYHLPLNSSYLSHGKST